MFKTTLVANITLRSPKDVCLHLSFTAEKNATNLCGCLLIRIMKADVLSKMALSTFETKWLQGRIRTVTPAVGGWYTVTVECPYEMWAFTFKYEGRLRLWEGTWIRFRGKVRMDPGLRKTGPNKGEPYEQNLVYRHDPFDGSNRKNWIFFEILWPDLKTIPSPEIADLLREADILIRRRSESWQHNLSEKMLLETATSLDRLSSALVRDAEFLRMKREDFDAPILTHDITV